MSTEGRQKPDPTSGGFVEAIAAQLRPVRMSLAEPSLAAVPFGSPVFAGRRLALDLYHPGAELAPAVFLVHGGGFLIGNRRMTPMRILASWLLAEGFAVIAPSYRLLGRGGRFPHPLQDLRAALLASHESASEWGIDPTQLHLAGLSAGASLALLVAGGMGAPAAESRPPLASVTSFFAPTDFSQLQGLGMPLFQRWLTREGDPEEVRRSSPIAKAEFPEPLLMIHGSADRIVPLAHAERLADRRAELHCPTRLSIYEGAPHGFFCDEDSPHAARALAEMLSFLREARPSAKPRSKFA